MLNAAPISSEGWLPEPSVSVLNLISVKDTKFWQSTLHKFVLHVDVWVWYLTRFKVCTTVKEVADLIALGALELGSFKFCSCETSNSAAVKLQILQLGHFELQLWSFKYCSCEASNSAARQTLLCLVHLGCEISSSAAGMFQTAAVKLRAVQLWHLKYWSSEAVMSASGN